jgi:hypothetical protein
MKQKPTKRLQIKRETLRELNPRDLALANGARISDTGDSADASNCCCNPTSNQGDFCTGKPAV